MQFLNFSSRTMLRIPLASFILAALAACSGNPEPISYYKTHSVERNQVLAKCTDDVQRASTDGDCLNASTALQQEQEAVGRELAAKAMKKPSPFGELSDIKCLNGQPCPSPAKK